MNRWKGIVEFVAVVEAGSFSKAAENLSVTVSQVSKRVNELENRLNARLLFRTTRSVSVSPEGEGYYQSCKKIMDEFHLAEDRISSNQDEPQGLLKIAFIGGDRPSFQNELIAHFLKRYPHISIEILCLDALPNLVEEGIDFALIVGDPEGDIERNPDAFFRIAQVDCGLCASPTYLDKSEKIHQPSDLEEHLCIVSQSNTWHLTNGTDEASIDVSGCWKSANVRSCVDAMLCDMGIFVISISALEQKIKEGKLSRVLPEWFMRVSIYATLSDMTYVPVKVRLLVSYLYEALGFMPDDDNKDLIDILKQVAESTREVVDID